jgi:hypothetical protein
MDPRGAPSRFYVESGVPYFETGEDGTTVRHRLTEFRPGLFLAENGETLDLRAPSPRWRGVDLTPVTGGPLTWQWALLAGVVVIAAGWLLAGCVSWIGSLRRRRTASPAPVGQTSPPGRTGRRVTVAVASVGALAALASVAAILALPALVDAGFLGSQPIPVPMRLGLHLPLAVALLAAGLAALLVAGAALRWWARRVRPRDAALAVALTALAAQLAAWHLVGWGF